MSSAYYRALFNIGHHAVLDTMLFKFEQQTFLSHEITEEF